MKLLNACVYGLPGGIMGLMNTNNTTKYIIVALSLFVSATLLYGAVAYATHLWPFTVSQTVSPDTKSSTSNPSPKITMVKPTVDTDKKILHTDTVIDTKEQGDCKLTLTSGDNVYVLTNSTKGLKDRTGCLDWNIGTGNMVAGEYDLEIKFIGKTQTTSAKQKVTIP